VTLNRLQRHKLQRDRKGDVDVDYRNTETVCADFSIIVYNEKKSACTESGEYQ
jgi:hypothetical protein